MHRSWHSVGSRGLFNTLRYRLEFVHITLNDENPFQIFKSLNSTGVDLAESDLIRNFMFMRVGEANQERFDEQHWKPLEQHFETRDSKGNANLSGKDFSSFLRDFLMRDGEYVGVNATFEEFERRYKSGLAPAEIVEQLNSA
jgi:uncharacterized protein with ParB-like and HNH nuclease domain